MFVRVLTYLMAFITFIQAFKSQCSDEKLINIMKEEKMCATEAQTPLIRTTGFDQDVYCEYLQNVAKCEKGYIECYSIEDVKLFEATIVELNISMYIIPGSTISLLDLVF